MVRAIPFGNLQKIWAVIWGEQFLVCLGAYHLTFEGVWVISEKNMLHIVFERKKILQGNSWGEKYPTLKKGISRGL